MDLQIEHVAMKRLTAMPLHLQHTISMLAVLKTARMVATKVRGVHLHLAYRSTYLPRVDGQQL